MKKITSTAAGICCLLLLLTSCKNPPDPTAPAPTGACAKLAFDFYNCEDGNPGYLLYTGKGGLKLSVIGDNPVQFSQITAYTPATFSSPSITYQNGTGSAGGHSIGQGVTTSNLNFNVPVSDSYTIKAFYIEYGSSAPAAATGNTATCTNPGTNQCYRWYKMVSLANGSRPDCNSFSVVINNMDPSGFIGNCN